MAMKPKNAESRIRLSRLADVDEEVLRELIREAAAEPVPGR